MTKITLSHPERLLYPDDEITKLDLANYYESVQEWILPYVKNRLLSLLRCPKGYQDKCFYQKHLHESQQQGLFTLPVEEHSKTESYIYLKNSHGLQALSQLGVLEIHPWGSLIDDIDKPDIIIFDLDPAPDVAWKKVINAAFHLKSHLESVNLQSFVKTTGGKGLHVVIPIRRHYPWEQIKNFTHTFVDFIVAKDPDDFVSTINKAKRQGKIFIDYLRNQKGATAIAPYSTRARKGAPVATPLSWDELTPRIKSDTFNIKNIPLRLKDLRKDPWHDFFKLHQSLTNLTAK